MINHPQKYLKSTMGLLGVILARKKLCGLGVILTLVKNRILWTTAVIFFRNKKTYDDNYHIHLLRICITIFYNSVFLSLTNWTNKKKTNWNECWSRLTAFRQNFFVCLLVIYALLVSTRIGEVAVVTTRLIHHALDPENIITFISVIVFSLKYAHYSSASIFVTWDIGQ